MLATDARRAARWLAAALSLAVHGCTDASAPPVGDDPTDATTTSPGSTGAHEPGRDPGPPDDGGESSSSTTTTAGQSSCATTTEDGAPGRPPPAIVLSAPVAASGGWLYAVIDAPLVEVELTLDHHRLGDPDERIDVAQPIGVWRVPSTLAPGPHELGVRWRDDEEHRTTVAIEITAPEFVDIAATTGLAGIHDVQGSPDECARSHTGVAAGDFDGDGHVDLFVGNVGAPSRLHRSLGARDGDPLEFEEVAEAVGLGDLDQVAMATFVDVDGDDDLDLFVGRRGTNRMYRNRLVPDGVAAFDDVSDAVGLAADSQRTMGAAFGDYDGDGDLDLYVVNHAWCYPEVGSEIRAEDHLYRNDDGVFVERTGDMSPIAGRAAGFSAAWVDIERDGDVDLVVINDDVGGEIGDPNELWRNDGPSGAGAWKFTDASIESGVAVAGVEGMGLGLGDVDGDGFVDLAFTNVGANVLLRNHGDGTFEDISAAAGIERASSPWNRTSVTWATHLWDRDDDGDLDLYFTGGAVKADVPVPDALFDNQLADGGGATFVDRTWDTGMADPGPGKGSLIADLDGDGGWDVVTASWAAPLRVWHNRSDRVGRHWIDVALRGRGGNRAAIGAIVELDVGGVTQTCFHGPRPALGAGGEDACHFGLGDAPAIDGLRVTWPDGEVQAIDPPAVDQRVVVTAPP